MPAPPSLADPIGFGIIGSGYMGHTYAESLARHNTGARLVAFAGGTRAPKRAQQYSVEAEPSVEALLARPDIEAVIITSPQSAHKEQTIAAARSGKHALVEKPMALNTAECDAMIAACREAGVKLSVIKPWRYRGTGREAGKVVLAGRIGPVQMLQMWWLTTGLPFTDKAWFRDPKEGGSVLDAGSHCVDYLRWLAQSEPVRVYGTVRQFADEQSAMAQIDFASGAIANLWLSYELPKPGWPQSVFRTRVVGARGILDIDGYGALTLGQDNRSETLHVQEPIDATGRMLEWARMEAFVLLTQDFIDALREDREPVVTGEDGRAAVAMVEAIYRSSESGQAIAL